MIREIRAIWQEIILGVAMPADSRRWKKVFLREIGRGQAWIFFRGCFGAFFELPVSLCVSELSLFGAVSFCRRAALNHSSEVTWRNVSIAIARVDAWKTATQMVQACATNASSRLLFRGPSFFDFFASGRHICRTKLPPKKFYIDTKSGLKNAKKGSEKPSEMCPKNVEPLSRRLNIAHQHLSKRFSPPKICSKMLFFTARLCKDSQAKAV